MRKALLFAAMAAVLMGCVFHGELVRRHSPGAEDIGGSYRLILLQSDTGEDSIRAAVLDLEDDGLAYMPHPEEKSTRIINGLSFVDASEEAFQSLKKQCGFFTLNTRRLTSQDNVTTGYEILPVMEETLYCSSDKPVALRYSEPLDGVVTVRLPAKVLKPFGFVP